MEREDVCLCSLMAASIPAPPRPGPLSVITRHCIRPPLGKQSLSQAEEGRRKKDQHTEMPPVCMCLML